MATATIPDTRTTPPAIIEYDISALEQRVGDAWAAYQQKAEPLGLDFGRACYELRKQAEVVQGGTSFRATLEKFGIPKSTAYFWIDRHEIYIGEKEPKPEVEPAEPQKPEKPRGSFDELISKLYSLTTSGNDGVEHKMVTLLDDAESYIKNNPTLDEGAESSRKTVVYLLNRVAKEFQARAERLNAEVV